MPEAAAAAAAEVRRVIEEDGRGGAAFGIVVSGETVVAEGFGFADTEGQTPARADHLYRIGSITKPVTAMAMLRLVHLEKARFGDPVTKFVPELAEVENPYSWTPGPSIFQLATMTAGLAREPRNLPRYLVGAPRTGSTPRSGRSTRSRSSTNPEPATSTRTSATRCSAPPWSGPAASRSWTT